MPVTTPIESTLLEAGRLADRAGFDDLLARASLANTRGFVGTVDPLIADRVDLLRAALGKCAPDDVGSRARLLATLAVETRGMDPSADCGPFAEEAVVLARGVGDPRLLAHVLNMAVFAMWLPATLQERLELTAEACALGRDIGGGPLLHWSANWRVHALIEAGEVDEAVTWLDVIDEVASDAGQPSLQWLGPSVRGGLSALQGDLQAARELADASGRRAVDVTEMDALSVRLAVLTMCAWHEGKDDPEIARGEAHPIFQDPSWQSSVGNRSYFTAERALVGGHPPDHVRAWLDEWRVERQGRGIGAIGYACVLAERCPEVGTRDQAAGLLRWLWPHRGQVASMAHSGRRLAGGHRTRPPWRFQTTAR